MRSRNQNAARAIAALLTALTFMLFVSACGSTAPSAEPVETTVARSVAATLAAQPTSAPALLESPTEAPTATVAPSATNEPTSAPEPTITPKPTKTPAPTETQGPTHTPAPTNTPTRAPGIGDLFKCGRDWTVRVLKEPLMGKTVRVNDPGGYGSFFTGDAAKGTWLVLLFELTNMQGKTDSLSIFGDEISVRGDLNGREVSFSPTTLGPSMLQEAAGISDWSDDVPPGISIKAIIDFDVNPQAQNLRFVLETDSCKTVVPLVDNRQAVSQEGNAQPGASGQAATSDTPVVLVGAKNVNLRSGPGTAYPVAGQGLANTRYAIVASNGDRSWWQIQLGDKQPWVAASVVTALGPVEKVAVAKAIPTPPPAPPTQPPAPTKAPVVFPKTVPLGQEFPTTLWGLKLYDVKRTKVVYFFGDATIANGTYLIALVEVRNLGSGTADPHNNLHFYLQDERGRTFTYDPFGDAVLGASWQFKAGHLYDDVNPGNVLGVALPFDVGGDLGDVWLRVKEAPGVVMYLGNVSQMPESK